MRIRRGRAPPVSPRGPGGSAPGEGGRECELGDCHGGHNSAVPISRISWIVTVGICLLAALLLLLNGYSGYFGVLLAVGAAAAVNLVGD